MPRWIHVALFLALTISCASPGDGDSGRTIDGTWLASTAEIGGQPMDEDDRKSLRLVVGDGKYSATLGKETDQGTVTLDPSTNPKRLDIVVGVGPSKGRKILAIYERTGDTMRICYDLSGDSRPTEFATTFGSLLLLVDFEREMPEAP